MPRKQDLQEYTPRNHFKEDDWELGNYWTQDNQVYFRSTPLWEADKESFRLFRNGIFAKDRLHCYWLDSRLKGVNPQTFRPLNFAFMTDDTRIWTMNGLVKGVDTTTFEVLDDGYAFQSETFRLPFGFARDRKRVFHVDCNGKVIWVRRADPASFEVLGDGFGRDKDRVFFAEDALPWVRVTHWERLSGLYSRDDRRVYHGPAMLDADVATFHVLPDGSAHDKDDQRTFYGNYSVRPDLTHKPQPTD